MSEKTARNGLLAGKTVVVTGSTRGIGLAIAREMADAGAAVLIHGRDRARGEEARKGLPPPPSLSPAAEHGLVLYDLIDFNGHERLVKDAWQWAAGRPVSSTRSDDGRVNGDPNRGVDVWVNNAGVDVLTGAAADWTFEQKLAILWQVDVLATMRLSRFVLDRMRPHGGTIINIGWDQASVGMGGDSGEMFAAVKGAVMAFTKSLAKSAAPTVRVNCVAPGWIRTAWGAVASDYWNARAVGESLSGRWGQPMDVARTVRFLASPDASFLNGQTIEVNGGMKSWSDEVT